MIILMVTTTGKKQMKKFIISGVMALSVLSLQGCNIAPTVYSVSWDSSLDPEYHEKHGLPYYSNEGLPYKREHEADDVGPKAKKRLERERIERERKKQEEQERKEEVDNFIVNNFSKAKPISMREDEMVNPDTLW